MRTSITILCATRPHLLKQALDSIGDLSDAHVAIRDAGMNPEVLQIIKDWGEDKNCYLTTTPDKIGTGEARNRVIGMSRVCNRGEYLYLSDDDVFWLRPDWLSILTAAYEKAWEKGFRVIGAYGHPYHRPIDAISVGDGVAVCEVNALPLALPNQRARPTRQTQ